MSNVSDSTEIKVSFLSSVRGIVRADFNVRLQDAGSDQTYYANTYSGKDAASNELPQPLKAILDALFSDAGCANHVYVHPFSMQIHHSRAVESDTIAVVVEEAIKRSNG